MPRNKQFVAKAAVMEKAAGPVFCNEGPRNR